MKQLRLAACSMPALLFISTVFCQTNPVSVVVVTDYSWEVSGRQTKFGEYPLSAEQIIPPTAPMYGGTFNAVEAAYPPGSRIISGSRPIWRFGKAEDSWEAYQFRKTVALGAEPILKATLQVNCDDAARVYINQRLVDTDHSGAMLNDAHGGQSFFRNLTTAIYSNARSYDVTDFFYTNVTNTIFVEVANQPFNDNHGYLSAKLVIELAPIPPPAAGKPVAATPAKPQSVVPASRPAAVAATTSPEPGKTVFEAGSDPELEKLRVGSILELGHVYFKVNDYKLDSASYRTLSSLAGYMKRHPGLKIEVGGHTNLLANEKFSAELSTNRARAVRQYLLDNGVPPDRVTFKGYGKSSPRVNATTKEANQANQRVEVKVLEK